MLQASSETLQCPRCSASVPAHPGVCGNCGENVFQCHKCRSVGQPGILQTPTVRFKLPLAIVRFALPLPPPPPQLMPSLSLPQSHQLRREGPVPVQRVWLLQVRQVRLHADGPALLRRRPHRERGGPEEGRFRHQLPPGAGRQDLQEAHVLQTHSGGT